MNMPERAKIDLNGAESVASFQPGSQDALPNRSVQPSTALSVDGVSKTYAKHPALVDVSFDIAPGTLTSLLGPNGAGKTTLLEIICGLRRAESGRAVIFGQDSADLKIDQRKNLGIVLQHHNLPHLLKVGEYLSMVAAAYGVDLKQDGLVEEFSLSKAWNKRIGYLSGGQSRKLALLAALTGQPKLLVLDEPTSNLDPFSRLAFWKRLRELSDDPAIACAILMATHDMVEATQLSTDIIMLGDGHVREAGTPADLIGKFCDPAILTIPVSGGLAQQEVQSLAGDLPGLIIDQSDPPGRIQVTLPVQHLDDVMKSELRNSLKLSELRLRNASLEDVFISVFQDQPEKPNYE